MNKMTAVRVAAIAAACVGVGSTAVLATPYASQISISGNQVTFNLNEAADAVSVKIGGVTTPLSTAAGFQSFNLPSATTPFSIKVDKASGSGYTDGTVLQVGTDTVQNMFGSPRGVAVNQNPGPLFGRIYVSNDNNNTAPVTNAVGIVRQTGAGIYVLNADQTDALGQGDAALDPISGGAWGTVGNAPWHITVGPDNNLYIADAGSTVGSAAMLYRTNPDVTTGDYMLFGLPGNDPAQATANGHGRIYGSPVVHIDNTGAVSVYATDGDLNNGLGFNAIQRYDLGVNPTTPGAPVPATAISNPTAAPNAGGISGVRGVTTDLDQGPKDGRFYFTENRSAGGQPGLFVVNPADGSIVWDSLTDTKRLDPSATVDLLTQTRSVAVSPDNKYLAMITDTDKLNIVPLTLSLSGVDGLPDLANMKTITTAFPLSLGFGRDVGFDAAGNLYAVSSDNLMLRVFSPGGMSSYTTSFDGTNFAFAATSTPPRITGDTNGDGVVDLADLNNVLNNFGSNTAGNPGDDNGDNVVDLQDLNNVLNNFGAHAAAGALAVPEPAGLGLLAAGTVALVRRRRRA